ncbi:MAG TPA: hypothetical protein PLR25_18485 [Planctomycetaceae bacterium]|nr:hypothetical protein [Planctomycetaceae bacterium]
MSLSESLLWSVVRSTLIASIAVWPVAIVADRIEASQSVCSRRWRLLLAVFPFFMPELLIGFNYRLTATQLSADTSPIGATICTEGLYGLLTFSRCMAVGVALSLLLPSKGSTDESLHSWRLLQNTLAPRTWWRGWLQLKIFGTWQSRLIGWSVMALFALQEFETAALMQIDRHPISWTVWLFDAHAARLPLEDSLRIIIGPLLCELLMLLPAIFLLWKSPPSLDIESVAPGTRTVKSSDSLRFSALLTPGIVLFLLWPLINNFLPTLQGLMLMGSSSTLGKSLGQILASTGFAFSATLLSMGAAVQICRPVVDSHNSNATRLLWMSLLLPGLLGSLILSLGLLALFQLPLMRSLYDTWLPMLLGQTLAVLPLATAVVLLLMRVADPAALHSAKLLSVSVVPDIRRHAAKIQWRLTTGRWLLGGLVVAHRCFWDVTVASILRPVQLEPVVTRLYNEMHYGRTEALMSLSLLAALTPLAIGGLAYLASGWIMRKVG